MKEFLQFEKTIVLVSSLILFMSCSTNTKKQTEVVIAERQATANMLIVDSTIFLKGEAIFKADCNKCHVAKGRLHNYLEGVVQRVGIDYLKLYLTKQDSLISAKDSNALMVKSIYNQRPNSHNFTYTDEVLNAVIEYLK